MQFIETFVEPVDGDSRCGGVAKGKVGGRFAWLDVLDHVSGSGGIANECVRE